MDTGFAMDDPGLGLRWDAPDRVCVDKLRWKVKMLARTGRYGAAEFWMDKIACLSNYRDLNDYFDMCEYLFLDGQFAACRSLIESRCLHKSRPEFLYLLGRCHFANGDLEEALKVLNSPVSSHLDTARSRADQTLEEEFSTTDGDVIMNNAAEQSSCMPSSLDDDIYLSAIQILRGKIYNKLDNQQMACSAYMQALEIDPFSSDALDYLTARHAVQHDDREKILADVVPRLKLSPDSSENSLAEAIYLCKLQPDYNLKGQDLLPWRRWDRSVFASNPDFLLTKAEHLLGRRDYVASLQITSRIMKIKPFYRNALPVHICALVHLERCSELFDLSHRLTALYPHDVVAWYATAAYYYICGGTEMTRRYLAKAINLDKSCGFVWLLYGHSFSREREHEQALAAYFHAVDVMKGSSFPYLYIAREYVRTNNFVLAEKFYGEARNLSPDDPVVLYEVGVMHIKKADSMKGPAGVADSRKDLSKAVEHLKLALKIVKAHTDEQKMLDSSMEGILESLAAAYIKLREGKEGILYATMAFQITSKSSAVLKLLGMGYVLLGRVGDAVDAFQRALAVNKDDTMAKKMLNETTELFAKEGLSSSLVALDIRTSRKIRTAKVMQDMSRLPVKRASSVKRKSPQVTSKSVDLSESSAMEMSVSMDLASGASFMGDFQTPSSSVAMRDVSILVDNVDDSSVLH